MEGRASCRAFRERSAQYLPPRHAAGVWRAAEMFANVSAQQANADVNYKLHSAPRWASVILGPKKPKCLTAKRWQLSKVEQINKKADRHEDGRLG